MPIMKTKPKYAYVWRLEDENGEGIYRGGKDKLGKSYVLHCTNLNDWSLYGDTRYPTPWNDKGLVPQLSRLMRDLEEFHFGFRNLQQFYNWIHRAEWRRNFSTEGVVLNKYRVNVRHVKIGDAQAMFLKKHAVLIETRKPDFADTPLKIQGVSNLSCKAA